MSIPWFLLRAKMKKWAHFSRESDEDDVRNPLVGPLFNDMVECSELLEKATDDNVQFARRTYFRSSFAYFEGHLYLLRTHITQWLLFKGASSGRIETTKMDFPTNGGRDNHVNSGSPRTLRGSCSLTNCAAVCDCKTPRCIQRLMLEPARGWCSARGSPARS